MVEDRALRIGPCLLYINQKGGMVSVGNHYYHQVFYPEAIKGHYKENGGLVKMSAEVESMFYVRETPWHGLGTKVKEAPSSKEALQLAGRYMDSLGEEFEKLRKIPLSDKKVMEYIRLLIPEAEGMTPQQKKNIKRMQEGLSIRYFDAPDLAGVGKNAYRFINAASDFATHAEPIRKTRNYRENVFARTIGGNPLVDHAYNLVQAA